jgi:hypothetical protein
MPTAPEPDSRFAALVEHFADQPGVVGPGMTPRRGFGSNALTVHGSIFAMLSGGRLVLKLPRHRVEQLITAGQGDPYTAGKTRPMAEWVIVTTDDPATWQTLAHEALDFVGRQPRSRR